MKTKGEPKKWLLFWAKDNKSMTREPIINPDWLKWQDDQLQKKIIRLKKAA